MLFFVYTQNRTDFDGKAVMDVGTGSGILAFFSAQAGARVVYAVEASDVAEHAKKLVDANGYGERIKVIKGKVESIQVPEKVDMIVSEPMGFSLVHERMLESYIAARDRFLKPNGVMFPSVGTIYVCPFSDQVLFDEQEHKVNFWYDTNFHGVDLSCLTEQARKDHFSQPVVGYFDTSILISDHNAEHSFDFKTVTKEELTDFEIPIAFEISRTAVLHGFAVWFDVLFNGKTKVVRLSTAPDKKGTHWYQARFLLLNPLAVNKTQVINGSIKFTANKSKSYDIAVNVSLEGSHIQAKGSISLQDQMYHYLQSHESNGYDQQQTTW